MNFTKFYCLIMCLVTIQCSHIQNYKDAVIVQKADAAFIKLKGKGEGMIHDLKSLFAAHTYEDSVLIPVPFFTEGTIKGADIPVRKGYYKFKGQIIIKGDTVKVDLVVIDTDDHLDRPYTWNGAYQLNKEEIL